MLPPPAWDVRFVSWGGEIASTREYVAAMAADKAQLQAVFNFDQSGFGSSKEALYVEPDDIPVNKELITLVRSVMTDHLGGKGFPEHAASVKSQGGTDSYVFQNTRTPGATLYPSITLYTSAWDRERTVPVTEGFPPINWYPGEQPGMITVDGDPFYHSAGDTPANTTDTEPSQHGLVRARGTAERAAADGGAVGRTGNRARGERREARGNSPKPEAESRAVASRNAEARGSRSRLGASVVSYTSGVVPGMATGSTGFGPNSYFAGDRSSLRRVHRPLPRHRAAGVGAHAADDGAIVLSATCRPSFSGLPARIDAIRSMCSCT